MVIHLKGNFVFIIIISLFFISCSSNSKKEMTQSSIYFSAGTSNLMDKDYTSALTNLLKANELDPNNPDIITNLAMAYYFKGEKALAIKQLERSIELSPKNSDAMVNLGSIYFYDKQYEKAEKIYQKVLKDLTYDKQARTYYNLGLIYLERKKDDQEAEKYFKLSIKEDENYCPSSFQLGKIYFDRHQYNRALKLFREAGTGTCYEAPAPHYYHGLTLVKLKKFDDARMKFDEIETRFRKSPFAAKAQARAEELKSIEIGRKDTELNYSQQNLKNSSF